MHPLIILAAGLGSRFGGDKPLAPVGPGGRALLDYTVRDALAAGFAPIVVVTSRSNRELVERHLSQHGHGGDVVLVVQDDDELVPPRRTPWGTVHAVVATRHVVTGPAAIANADDHYGAGAFALLRRHMEREPDLDHIVAYRWDRTLPPTGTANRGVCVVDSTGRLRRIEERRGLVAHDLAPETLVSMNLWGLSPSTLARLADRLDAFVAGHRGDPDAELALSEAMGELVEAGAAVMVHPTDEQWIGITYPADVEWARARLAAAGADGVDGGVEPARSDRPGRREAPRGPTRPT